MRLPWQKESSAAAKTTTPPASSTVSSPEKSIEAQEAQESQEPQDGEGRIIFTTEDEKSNSPTSFNHPQTAEQVVRHTAQSRAANAKETDIDRARTASRATEASNVDEAGDDDKSKYPKALPLAVLTFGLCLSTFVVALDNTIIGTIHNS